MKEGVSVLSRRWIMKLLIRLILAEVIRFLVSKLVHS
jgi:hypothetical protein